MPKLCIYFGLVVYFYANEHEPVDYFVKKIRHKPEVITRKLK